MVALTSNQDYWPIVEAAIEEAKSEFPDGELDNYRRQGNQLTEIRLGFPNLGHYKEGDSGEYGGIRIPEEVLRNGQEAVKQYLIEEVKNELAGSCSTSTPWVSRNKSKRRGIDVDISKTGEVRPPKIRKSRKSK